MNANNIEADFKRKAAQLERYALQEFPRMAKRKALRFIDGNFRAQGWQGRSFLPWQATRRGSTILVKTGAGRRSIHGDTSPGEVRIYSNSPYMRYHNRGFKGTVQVKGHTKLNWEAYKTGTGRYNTKSGKERKKTLHRIVGTTDVQAHQRQMNLAKRQFMPESPSDSPILFDSIKRSVVASIKAIFE